MKTTTTAQEKRELEKTKRQLQKLINEAREKGLWFYSNSPDGIRWRSPKEFEEENERGLFIDNPLQWELRNPNELIQGQQHIITVSKLRIKSIQKRMYESNVSKEVRAINQAFIIKWKYINEKKTHLIGAGKYHELVGMANQKTHFKTVLNGEEFEYRFKPRNLNITVTFRLK